MRNSDQALKRVKEKDIFNNQCNLSILFFLILTNFHVFLLPPVTRNSHGFGTGVDRVPFRESFGG